MLRRDYDCLKKFRERVVESGIIDPQRLDEIDKEVPERVAAAVAAAKAAPRPTRDMLTTDVYISY